MEIEDSSPYRGFLRSGSYPALSQRVVRGGGVVARAAGWFALVATASSAGYNLTQRWVQPPPASAVAHSLDKPQRLQRHFFDASFAATETGLIEPVPLPIAPITPNAPHEPTKGMSRAAAELATHRPVSEERNPLANRRRPGAGSGEKVKPTQSASRRPASASSDVDGARDSLSLGELAASVLAAQEHAAPDEAGKDDGRKLGSEGIHAANAANAANDANDAAYARSAKDASGHAARERRARASGPAASSSDHPRPVTTARSPRSSGDDPSSALVAASSLSASAEIEALKVRGPLSSAHVRHSVERIQEALSECYSDAAHRAGHGAPSRVHVALTIDEAGRIKKQPKVHGRGLPGLGSCLSVAFSKLVCRAPDTGLAKASITLRFTP